MSNITIGNACYLLNGYAFKSSLYVDNGIRVIRIANVQKGYIEDSTPAFYPLDSKGLENYMLKEGDLLMSLTGNVGRVALLSDEMLPAVLNQRVACLRLKDDSIDKKFLFHYLNSSKFENKCIQESKGVAQKNMSTEWLKRQEIPNFSYAKQKEISKVLDDISDIVKLKTKQLSEYDQLIKSRFVEMFGDPVVNNKNWKQVNLKKLTTKVMSGNTPKGGSQVYVNDGILFFRSQNVWKNRIELDDIAYIDEETHKKMSRSSLKHKDILMTKTGRMNTKNSSLGRAAMYLGEDGKANINGHVYLIRLNEVAAKEFVLFILTTIEYRDYIRSVCVGGIDKRQLNKNHIEEFPIILPPRKDQDDFVSLINQVDKLKFEDNFLRYKD